VRIGLDARTLASAIRSGVEHYVVNLVRALAELDSAPEIIAYLDRPISDSGLAQALAPGPIATRVVGAKLGWLRVALPWRLWRDSVDLVHLPSTIVPPVLPCPAVVTVHDLAWARYPETYDPADLRMQTRVVPRSVRRATHVIAVSQSTARDVSEVLRVPPEKVTAIPLGVAPAFTPDGPGLSSDAFPGAERARDGYVLHPATGGPHPRKNVARMLEAYARLRPRRRMPPLVIAGDAVSPAARELRSRADSLGLGEEIIFSGTIASDVMPALYRTALAVVYPSLYEGFGLPVLEAMASGVPAITSNRSSMLEVAGEAALLVDPEDVEGLASALERVLTDAELRRDLRARGLARAKQFTWDRTARETIAVYRSTGHAA
jgi:glycosyltransferase involved in cell wall biosynthesis